MITIDKKDYKIIDVHTHLPWQDEYKTIKDKEQCLIDELKKNKIDSAVLIADSLSESCIGNNQECFDVVKRNANLKMVYGFTPLERFDEQLTELNEMLEKKEVIGVKLYPGHEDFCMNDPRLNKVFEICIKFDVPIVIHTEWNWDYYPQYSHPFFISQIAEKYKDLRIVCAHIWIPRSIESIKQTIKHDNIFYDMSSFAFDDEYKKLYPKATFITYEKAIEILEEIISKNPDKIMFGSDFGTLKIDAHIEIVSRLNISELNLSKLLFKNAQKIYRI